MARIKGCRVAKGSPQAEPARVVPVKLKLTVPPEVARQLKIEALGRGCSIGELVGELLRGSRRYYLAERGPRGASVPGADGPRGVEGGPGDDGGPITLGVLSEAS